MAFKWTVIRTTLLRVYDISGIRTGDCLLYSTTHYHPLRDKFDEYPTRIWILDTCPHIPGTLPWQSSANLEFSIQWSAWPCFILYLLDQIHSWSSSQSTIHNRLKNTYGSLILGHTVPSVLFQSQMESTLAILLGRSIQSLVHPWLGHNSDSCSYPLEVFHLPSNSSGTDTEAKS